MNKAIISFALGDAFSEMLSISSSRLYKYAQAHNYDLFIPTYQNINQYCIKYGWSIDRPPSWLKIPIIKHLFDVGYDLVQWIDADVIINKFDKDINEHFIQSECIQAFVIHHDSSCGYVPNCGIWSLKKSAIFLLDEIWSKTEFLNHSWWEQAANINIMQNNQDIIRLSFSLPYEFNVHKNDLRFKEKNWEKEGTMLHATMWPNRIEKIKEWNLNPY